jgi:hypothetical protein
MRRPDNTLKRTISIDRTVASLKRRRDLAVARSAATNRKRITAMAVLGLLLVLPIANAPLASAAIRNATQWTHPKAHSWYSHNSFDIETVLKGQSYLYLSMRGCPAGTQPTCDSPPSRDPEHWPVNIVSSNCAPLLSTIFFAKGDGHVPNKTAQRLWSTTLRDDQQACAEIANAVALDQAKSVNGNLAKAQHDASIAVDDVIASKQLLARFGDYVNAHSGG